MSPPFEIYVSGILLWPKRFGVRILEDEARPGVDHFTRLTYASTREPAVDETQVAELIARASSVNRALGINSCLYVAPGRFLQVLEGPQRLIDAMYRRINADPRHHSLRLLGYLSATGTRQFSRWGMARVGRGEDPALDALIEGYTVPVVAPHANEEPDAVQTIISRLRALVQLHTES